MGLSALILSLPFAVTASSHGAGHARRHEFIARNIKNDTEAHDLATRDQTSFTNERFTWYDVGLGACGQTNVPGDFIVALTHLQFGSGYPAEVCFSSITIEVDGKQAQATIMDECMGCPYGGLDFSKGLFEYFAPTSVGVLTGNWWFNDGGAAPAPSPTPSPTHTTTPPPPPPPKTTSTPPPPPPPPKTTSTPPPPPPPPTTTSTHHSSTHTTSSVFSSSKISSSSVHSSSSVYPSSSFVPPSSSSTPTPTPTSSAQVVGAVETSAPTGQAVAAINEALVGLAALVDIAAGAQQ